MVRVLDSCSVQTLVLLCHLTLSTVHWAPLQLVKQVIYQIINRYAILVVPVS